MLTELLVSLFKNMLDEHFYFLADTDLYAIHIKNIRDGLSFTFYGHPDHLPSLLKEFVSKMTTYLVDHQRFQYLKNKAVKSYRHRKNSAAYGQIEIKLM